MKKTDWLMLVSFSALAVGLRVGQELTGFDEAGLAERGNLYGLLLPLVLLAAAAYFTAAGRRLPAQRGVTGGMGERFPFQSTTAAACAVAGAFLVLASAASALLGYARSTRMTLLALPAVAAALCVLYAVFALRRGSAAPGVALLVPVCCLIVYLIFLYRADASDPVLARIYVEILAVAALTFSSIERAAFGFYGGAPRVWFPAGAMAVVLSLTAAVERRSLAAMLLLAGSALVELGFLAAADFGE